MRPSEVRSFSRNASHARWEAVLELPAPHEPPEPALSGTPERPVLGRARGRIGSLERAWLRPESGSAAMRSRTDAGHV